jgi:NAD+ kinase
MRIGVNGREMDAANVATLMRTVERMAAHGLEPHLTSGLAAWLNAIGETVPWPVLDDREPTEQDLDLFISLGGDGTLLDTVALVGRSQIPVLGINLGRLGFLSNVRSDTLEAALAAIKNGWYSLQERSLLEVTDHPELLGTQNFALNEVSIHKRDSASMIAVHVHLGEDYLNTYWADGLIIATPTGSTAYSLSCGGPVIYPTSGALVINPICPHNLNVRPFVVPDHYTIRLKLEARSDRCLMNLDSRSSTIDGQSHITVKRAAFSVRMVQLDGSNFLDTLRTKLSWGLDVRSAPILP